jgi:hypothetical protein
LVEASALGKKNGDRADKLASDLKREKAENDV